MDQNFLDLLQLFDQHKVKYLIIGGYAVSYHSEPRYTKDIDFWIECSPKNARKVFACLEEFGAPLATITAKDFSNPGTAYTAGLPPLRFDILTRIVGTDFASAYKKRVKEKIGEIAVYYVSLDDLVRIKKRAARPQDKLDVARLMRFHQQR